MDLTILTTEIQKLKARKRLWKLKSTYTAWMDEWKHMLFIEVNTYQILLNLSLTITELKNIYCKEVIVQIYDLYDLF